MPDNNRPDKLAIYFFYDVEGVVGPYVQYILSELSVYVNRLVVVCNGYLSEEGKKTLDNLATDVVITDNYWINASGYRAGMEYVGWDVLGTYDELIILDFTIYGPLYSFSRIFDEMENKEVDFWGITKHHEIPREQFPLYTGGNMPAHIQGYFMVFRNKLLNEIEFIHHWQQVKFDSYESMLCYHEGIFTRKFSDLGYKYDVYVPTDDLVECSYNPFIDLSYILVEERNCPFIQKKIYTRPYEEVITKSSGQNAMRTLEYIKNNSHYDVKMIWDDLIRTGNQLTIKRNLHLNYILSDSCIKSHQSTNKRVALMIHIYFKDLVDYCFEYAKSMPEYADVYITVINEDTREVVKKVFSKLKCNKLIIITMPNRGRDVSSILVALREYLYEYEYICFVHDKKSTQDKPLTVGKDFGYKCYENLLGSSAFVENVIHTFETNPRLGMLMPPPPVHGIYHMLLYDEWGGNYELVIDVAKRLGITIPIMYDKELISPLGTMFWFRPKALRTLIDYNWEYTDFPQEPNKTDGTILHAIERIYGLVVQHDGYYPAWVISDSYMSIELTNLNFLLKSSYKMHNTANLCGKEVVITIKEYVSRKLVRHPFLRKVAAFLFRLTRRLYKLVKRAH